MDNGQIILFLTQGGETRIEVRLSNETVTYGRPDGGAVSTRPLNHPTTYQKDLR